MKDQVTVIADLLRQAENTPLYNHPIDNDKLLEALAVSGRYLQANGKTMANSQECAIVFLSYLQQVVPGYSLKLAEVALELAFHGADLDLSSVDFPEVLSEDFLCPLVEGTISLARIEVQEPFILEEKGALVVDSGTAGLLPYDAQQSSRWLKSKEVYVGFEVLGRLGFYLPVEKYGGDPSKDDIHSILEFVRSFSKELRNSVKAEGAQGFSPVITKSLCRMLVACRNEFNSPYERYRILSAVRLICSMMEWMEDERYVRYLCDYLYNLVEFSDGVRKLSPLKEPQIPESADLLEKYQVVEILASWSKVKCHSLLEKYLSSEQEYISQLASLVLALHSLDKNASCQTCSAVRNEILRLVSSHEHDLRLEKEKGFCYGAESESVEFKTSFFFAPKGAILEQEFNICRTVCAFLNSLNGGRIYLGVNDAGYVVGIDDELREVKKRTKGGYVGRDGYIRYIFSVLKKYFDLASMTHISVEAESEHDVVIIEVKPSPTGIVKIAGQGCAQAKGGDAYIRQNSSTVLMKEDDYRQLIQSRMQIPSELLLLTHELEQAIQGRKQVILRNYPSRHGAHDHTVEPYAFNAAGDLVVCYDLYDNRCKVFKIRRINAVDIQDQEWKHQGQHRQLFTDIFRMTSLDQIPIQLTLDNKAKTLLLEEFPDAKYALKETLEEGIWNLSTNVASMLGVGRFYIGLADHVEIVHAPELQQYVDDYIEKYLKKDASSCNKS